MVEACALAAQLVLYRIRLVLVGAVEPVAQMGGGFLGSLAVEGHHGCGDAGKPGEMSPPASFGHPRDLNDIGAAGNGSFKPMAHDSFRLVSEIREEE
jgi:hypothetical protein